MRRNLKSGKKVVVDRKCQSSGSVCSLKLVVAHMDFYDIMVISYYSLLLHLQTVARRHQVMAGSQNVFTYTALMLQENLHLYAGIVCFLPYLLR